MAHTTSGLPGNLDKIGAKRGFFPRVPVGHLFFHPKGHEFEHPRARRPVDENLRDSILKEGYREDEPIVIWRQQAKGGEVTLNGTVLERGDALLLVGKGCRRGHASFGVEAVLRKEGKLKRDESFLVPVRDWSPLLDEGPPEAQFFFMVQEDDSRPFKLDHFPSEVASLLIRGVKWSASPEVGLEAAKARAPRHYDDRTVEFLFRWPELPAKVASTFDAGVMTVTIDGKEKEKKVNINLLPTLLDPDGLVPRDEMYSTLEALVAAGKQHWKGASRWVREQAAVEKVQARRSASKATPGEGDAGGEGETEDETETNSTAAPHKNGKTAEKRGPKGPKKPSPSAKLPSTDLPILVQQPSPKRRKELVEVLSAKTAKGAAVDPIEAAFLKGFTTGVSFSLGEDVQTVSELPEPCRDAIREVFAKLPAAAKNSAKSK